MASITILLVVFSASCVRLSSGAWVKAKVKITTLNNTRPATNGELLLLSLPVGQGDSTVIVCPEYDGKVVLVDAGSLRVFWTSTDVKSFLYSSTLNGKRSLMDRLSTVIVTHPDVDHYSYLKTLFGRKARDKPTPLRFDMPPFLNDQMVPDTKLQARVFDDLKVFIGGDRENYTSRRTEAFLEHMGAETFNKGDACFMKECYVGNSYSEKLCGANSPVRFQVVAANLGRRRVKNQNPRSVVLRITNGDKSALLVGDFEGKAERLLLNKVAGISPSPLKADVYKISHHGSEKLANSKDFLKAVQPRMAFASSAYASMGYGYPRCSVLKTLQGLGSLRRGQVHRLDCCVKVDNHANQVRTLNIAESIFTTAPVPDEACMLIIALVDKEDLRPAQQICWRNGPAKSRSHPQKKPKTTLSRRESSIYWQQLRHAVAEWLLTRVQ